MRLRQRTVFVLMMPAVALYSVFLIYPTIRGVLLSFTDAKGVTGGRFVGLANYRHLVHDQQVVSSLKNTVVYAVVVVVVQNVIALGVAYWLNSVPAVRNIVRAGLLLPSMMAAVTIGYIWTVIYSPVGGPLNALMDAIGLHRLEQVWLGDPKTALLAVAATNIWAFIGYSATIYLANYASIPASLFEACALDGATGWRRFRRIDWPLLAPALTINITLSTIGSLRVFDLPLVMTGGGPNNATQTLSFAIYQDAFLNFQVGYATAVAVVLLVFTVATSVLLATVLRRREVAF